MDDVMKAKDMKCIDVFSPTEVVTPQQPMEISIKLQRGMNMSANAFKGVISVLSILTDTGFKLEDKDCNLEMYINGPEGKEVPRFIGYHDGLIHLEMLYEDTLTIVLDNVCKSVKFSPKGVLLTVVTPTLYTEGFEMKEISAKEAKAFKYSVEAARPRRLQTMSCKYPC